MAATENCLSCPVCSQSLIAEPDGKFYRCQNNHCFDMAKQGYINLLTSNQKKSPLPGDSKEMIAARRRFLGNAHYQEISDRLNAGILSVLTLHREKTAEQSVGDLSQASAPLAACFTVLDLGCGEGYYTRRLITALEEGLHYAMENAQEFCKEAESEKLPVRFYGLDISKEAVKFASSTIRNATWIVGTNFHLPLKSSAFDCIFSVFSPVMPEEIQRVLKKEGVFIRILPGARHLIEIRDIIYPRTILNEEAETLLVHEGLQHIATEKIDYTINLNQEDLLDLVQMTPHYWKTSQRNKSALKAFSALDVTVSMLLTIYIKR